MTLILKEALLNVISKGFLGQSPNLTLGNGRGAKDQRSYLRLHHKTLTFFVKFPEFESKAQTLYLDGSSSALVSTVV